MIKHWLPSPPAFAVGFLESNSVAPTQSAARAQYMPQLDALRGLAISAVMFQHFYGSHVGIDLPIGDWGVQLFFVLSGFLITGILLDCRGDNENQDKEARKLGIRQFYIRRMLRIFPLYYLVVLGAALVNIRPFRESLMWHLTYTSNILISNQENWIGPASHLWSLAVEEQFYLVWPWLILWLPAKYLKPAIITVILLAPIFKIGGYFAGVDQISLNVLTLVCLDALGIGALLALYRKRQPQAFKDSIHDESQRIFGMLSLFFAILSCLFWEQHYLVQMAGTLSAILFFGWLIHRAAVGFTGHLRKFMLWKPLLYLGKISYGLYIFHKFISIIIPHVFSNLGLVYPENYAVQSVLLIGINILLASFTWYVIEKPINNLKNRFPYSVFNKSG